MRAAVIITGSELLHGQVRDENGVHIASRLFRTDLMLEEIRAVGDRGGDIRRALDEAARNYDLVFVTGGLGPTEDDVTCTAVCELYGLATMVHGPSQERMRDFFASRGLEPRGGDIKMVTVPAGAEVFPNYKGLACGFAVRGYGGAVVAMPGVPREMSAMFDDAVMPWLARALSVGERRHLVFRAALIREAEVDERVMSLGLPLGDMEWGICTAPGVNEITFAALPGAPFDEDGITARMEGAFGADLLRNASLQQEVVDLLAARGETLAVAESCTGGLIAARVTEVPGASRVFPGGVTAYGNEVKERLLGVRAETLERYGAVSEETAREMAEGVRRALGARIGLSVTGIAGPEGGTPEKPVGTVCFGFAWGGDTVSRREFFPGDRARIRDFSAAYSLNTVRLYLRAKG